MVSNPCLPWSSPQGVEGGFLIRTRTLRDTHARTHARTHTHTAHTMLNDAAVILGHHCAPACGKCQLREELRCLVQPDSGARPCA